MPRPVVGVMGGGSVSEDVARTARELGARIARRGWVLLNGGRDAGVMAASARGAREAGGTVVGVLPGRTAEGASPDLDIAIVTGLGDARNLVNVLSSEVVIACPGGAGTLSEVALALKNDRPVILLGLEPGPALERYRRTGFLRTAATAAEAVRTAAELLGEA